MLCRLVKPAFGTEEVWHRRVWDTIGFAGVTSSSFSRSGSTSRVAVYSLSLPSLHLAFHTQDVWDKRHVAKAKRYETGGMGHNRFSWKRDFDKGQVSRTEVWDIRCRI